MMVFLKLFLLSLLLCSSSIQETYQYDELKQGIGYGGKHGTTNVPKKGGSFASGSIKLGGLEVCQISKFKKVWATLEGGPDNAGATFYEPSSIPDGFFMLGSYAQPNNRPLFGWILGGKDIKNAHSRRTLKMPVDYTLVWSSETTNIKKEGNGYFWLPTPPDGYNAVGLIFTDSPNKPPLSKVRCVRSDLVEFCEQDAWIWGEDKTGNTSKINAYSSRPSINDTHGLGVPVGTFFIQVDGANKSLNPSCLKNAKYNLAYMPNATQIKTLVQTFSPRLYFHPDEPYFPSSVNWFFSKGALLYQKGNESNPVLIEPNGSNLPQGGIEDGAYWLDLPVNKSAQDEIKKGYLQSSVAYLHIKPMLGATFTDICIWIFYPFNGSARAKLRFINVGLGRLGEHVGDWEHVTLRVSNFNGELWRVYFSQHNKGTWVNAAELEFEGSKVVAYASLHGHAAYPKPGLVLQGDLKLGIGVRNDAAKGNIVMDTGLRYEIISAEYLGTVVEASWLNYSRKWGPKIEYDLEKELKAFEKLIPGHPNLAKILPYEVLGEDGPTGPKFKNNWSGDEFI
ncbi:vacuolar sorting-associated protein [Thalictrum thalictroides]|uniref:Vacuolar sorting-associated protein n=1 Tax=Thalictrum thalictroides TaxID=46969 RepID=A0A7J6UXY7_THATH|nr:vacuolar sorting-associated protein [Thalictrum thalictroides]